MKTPSKINAFLAVTGRRPDGYHTIETVFLPLAEPADEIVLTPSDDRHIVTTADIPRDASNLCWKAVDAFRKRLPTHSEWRIDIEKNIPIAGGMAGGSSDAAAVLLLLNHAHGNPLSSNELRDIAVTLGADVPFFIEPVPSLAEGIGEILTPLHDLPLLKIPLMLVFPNFPVPAAWAYANRQGPYSPKGCAQGMLNALRSGNLHDIAREVRNDLAPAVFGKFPLLQNLRRHLLDHGALAVELSGSGPTLFAIMPNEDILKNAEKTFKESFPHTPFKPTSFLLASR